MLGVREYLRAQIKKKKERKKSKIKWKENIMILKYVTW